MNDHVPLVDGFCPECAHEAHLDILAAQPVDAKRYDQLTDHLYDEHGIKPHPYRRGDPLWNMGMAEAVHRHIHVSADPEQEQGQEWWDHDVSDLNPGGLEYAEPSDV
jgi:hypothetical protein